MTLEVRDLRGTQIIRVLDVVAIGPVMIWAAFAAKKLPAPARAFLGFSGITTIVFNGVNLIRKARTGEP